MYMEVVDKRHFCISFFSLYFKRCVWSLALVSFQEGISTKHTIYDKNVQQIVFHITDYASNRHIFILRTQWDYLYSLACWSCILLTSNQKTNRIWDWQDNTMYFQKQNMNEPIKINVFQINGNTQYFSKRVKLFSMWVQDFVPCLNKMKRYSKTWYWHQIIESLETLVLVQYIGKIKSSISIILYSLSFYLYKYCISIAASCSLAFMRNDAILPVQRLGSTSPKPNNPELYEENGGMPWKGIIGYIWGSFDFDKFKGASSSSSLLESFVFITECSCGITACKRKGQVDSVTW